MSVNVSGDGALTWDASINTDHFEEGVNVIVSGLQKTADKAVEVAKEQNDALSDIGSPLKIALKGVDDSLADLLTNIRKFGDDPTLEALFTKFADLQKQELTLKDSLSHATDPEQIKAYNVQLDDTHAKMKAVTTDVANLPGVGSDLDNANKTIAAYTRLRQIKNELAQIRIDGGENSANFQNLTAEATQLEKAIKNTNSELKLAGSNTAGLDAIGQGVRGLVGGFQALAGAITIFGGDSKEAEQATKDVIGAMGILNGIQEVGSLLSKESALNVYLLAAARKAGAAAAAEQAVATEGIALAEGEVAVTTTAATGAQIGLNAAMLANPVGIILASLVALYGAYLIYANTLGKASDAEVRAKATREALDAANVKAIDTIAKEESSLQASLITLKDENATKAEKERVLNDLTSKYPEYLGKLTLENSLTETGNQLITDQLELIRRKAVAAATEDLYTDALKEQIKIQTELNRIKGGGEITTAERLKSVVSSNQQHTGALGFTTEADMTATAIKDLEDKLEEAKVKSDGVFKAMADGSKSLSDALVDPNEKIKELSKTLETFASHTHNVFGDMASYVSQALNKITIPKAFDKAAYDEAFNAKKDELNRELALTDQANAAQQEKLKAQLAKLNAEYVKNDETKKNNTQKVNSEILNADADLQAQLNSNNQAARERAYKAQTDQANAALLKLQAVGQQESNAYFDAKVRAIKAAAAEQINQERYNAAAIKKINEQLNLDLIQNALDRQKASLQSRIDENNANLLMASKGSQEELNLRLSNIKIEAQKELDVIGLTEGKKSEIRIKAEKDVADAVAEFYQQHEKDNSTVNISNIQAQIDLVKKGTAEEYSLQQQLIQAKARLAVQDEASSTDAEKVKIAKINEINVKAYADRLELERNFINSMLDVRNQAIEDSKNHQNADLDLIINDVTSSFSAKVEAQRQKLKNDYDALQQQVNNVQKQLGSAILNPSGLDAVLIDSLVKKLATLTDAANKAHLAINNNDKSNPGLDKASNDVGILAASFQTLADGARDLDDNLFKIIGTLSQITGSVKVAIDGFKQFKDAQTSGDQSGQIAGLAGIAGSVISVATMIVNTFKASHDSVVASKNEIISYNNSLIIGQTQYNQLMRQQELSQMNINNLSVSELETKKKLLALQKEQAQADYNSLLQQIQLQGKQITGEHTEKSGGSGLLGVAGYALGFGKKTKVVQDLAGLSGSDYDNLLKLFTEGKLDAATATWFQQLQKVHDELDAIGVSAADAVEAEKQALTGTTADSIADNIIQGFADGKRATSDFADDFESLMRTAVLNSLKYQALEKPLNAFYQQFADDAQSDGILTSAEIEQLRASYNATIQAAGEQFDQLKKITDLSFNGTDNSNSLQGAIKGITQQQADLLAGQFGGLRLTAFDQLAAAKSCLNALNEIVNNTSMIADTNLLLRKFDMYGIKIK